MEPDRIASINGASQKTTELRSSNLVQPSNTFLFSPLVFSFLFRLSPSSVSPFLSRVVGSIGLGTAHPGAANELELLRGTAGTFLVYKRHSNHLGLGTLDLEQRKRSALFHGFLLRITCAGIQTISMRNMTSRTSSGLLCKLPLLSPRRKSTEFVRQVPILSVSKAMSLIRPQYHRG